MALIQTKLIINNYRNSIMFNGVFYCFTVLYYLYVSNLLGMKKRLLLLVLLSIGLNVFAQTESPKYDAALAKKLGADEYGMKNYIMVILKTGSAKIEDKNKLNELFKGHMDNINKLADEGKLVVAGPFGKNDKNYRGIFIFNVKTVEEANALLAGDPAVKEKLLEAEILPWYGSAALGEYLKVHKTIEQKTH